MLFGKKGFSVSEMVQMEKELKDSVLYNMSADDEDLLEKLRLKLVYADDIKEAELSPPDDDNYCGIIRLNKSLENEKFAYIHEVIHYIFDVGYGKRVSNSFTRNAKGETKKEGTKT